MNEGMIWRVCVNMVWDDLGWVEVNGLICGNVTIIGITACIKYSTVRDSVRDSGIDTETRVTGIIVSDRTSAWEIQ